MTLADTLSSYSQQNKISAFLCRSTSREQTAGCGELAGQSEANEGLAMTLPEILLACDAMECKKGLPWHSQIPWVVSPAEIFATE